jgi:hypothetical protein
MMRGGDLALSIAPCVPAASARFVGRGRDRDGGRDEAFPWLEERPTLSGVSLAIRRWRE